MAEDDSLRDKETTMDEGEDSEISVVSTMPNHDWPKGKEKMVKIGLDKGTAKSGSNSFGSAEDTAMCLMCCQKTMCACLR